MDEDKIVSGSFLPFALIVDLTQCVKTRTEIVARVRVTDSAGGDRTFVIEGFDFGCSGCHAVRLPIGAVATLTINPVGGVTYAWQGDCQGTLGNTCQLTIDHTRTTGISAVGVE